MIFISVQPDEPYFHWQVKLLIFNLNRYGINPERIHILFSCKKGKLPSKQLAELKRSSKNASVYIYEDDRPLSNYLSSFRPYIIHKHFSKFKYLEKEIFFYHDSDILFNESPKLLDELVHDETIYASDTNSYTGFDYLTKNSTPDYIGRMCESIGIDFEKIRDLSFHGGAQYLLKRVTTKFWWDLYTNCELLFKFFSETHQESQKIQTWCTDIWCIWWMLADRNYQIKTHKLLDFYWAESVLEEDKLITHYTGHQDTKAISEIFNKGRYQDYDPFNEDFSNIDPSKASIKVVEEILKFNKKLDYLKLHSSDLDILIPIRIDSYSRVENIVYLLKYLTKNLDCKILILEADNERRLFLDKHHIDDSRIEYYFEKDDKKNYHRTHHLNTLIKLSKNKFISIYDADVIMSIDQFQEALQYLRNGFHAVSPYDGNVISVDPYFKKVFSLCLDIKILEQNIKKMNIATTRAIGVVIFFEREKYILAGGENEKFFGWGPEDIERWKRIETLGLKKIRLTGNIFHLCHTRIESEYSENDQEILYNEYFRIISLNKSEMIDYIKTWNYVQQN